MSARVLTSELDAGEWSVARSPFYVSLVGPRAGLYGME
jgi:hypothetical protein